MFQKSCTFDKFLIKYFAVKLIILFVIEYKKVMKKFKILDYNIIELHLVHPAGMLWQCF